MSARSFRKLLLLLLLALPAGAPAVAEETLLLATTTSVRDSGLLDELLPLFRERTGIHVKAVAVGTGAALRMGSEGNVDALITHAPEAERQLLESGALVTRRPFMENHFVIAGPSADPAGVRAAESASDAYRRMAAAEVPYVSRGDDSGTHKRERALLRSAGLPQEAAWKGFRQNGAGMGLTLQVAGELRAYTLSDIGTFLAYRDRTELAALSPADPELRNVYSLLRVSPERFTGRIRAENAIRFEEFIVDPEVQRRIGSFGVDRFGRPLFRPLLVDAGSGPVSD